MACITTWHCVLSWPFRRATDGSIPESVRRDPSVSATAPCDRGDAMEAIEPLYGPLILSSLGSESPDEEWSACFPTPSYQPPPGDYLPPINHLSFQQGSRFRRLSTFFSYKFPICSFKFRGFFLTSAAATDLLSQVGEGNLRVFRRAWGILASGLEWAVALPHPVPSRA